MFTKIYKVYKDLTIILTIKSVTLYTNSDPLNTITLFWTKATINNLQIFVKRRVNKLHNYPVLQSSVMSQRRSIQHI